MAQAVVVLDRVADMADWDQASFIDGRLVKWDATLGKFTAAPPSSGGGGSDSNYVHTQTVPDTTWIVDHNLGKRPAVTVVDSGGTQVEGSVQHVSDNRAIVTFTVAFGGTAYCN